MFKLAESFIEEFKGKQPKWGEIGYFVYKRCVSIDTPILTADLSWVPAGKLDVGTQLLAFEEFPKDGQLRKIVVGEITHNAIEEAECVEITLSNGEKIVCTPDHSWLVTKGTNTTLQWIEAKDLLSGDNRYNNNNPIKCYFHKFAPTWETDNSYEAGYLAAAFDGEGSLDRKQALNFAQLDNEMLKTVKNYLDKYGFKYHISPKKLTSPESKQCFSLRMYGSDNTKRFLGTFKPKRLLARYLERVDTMSLRRKQRESEVYVLSVESIGKRKVAVISTSTKTHFTAGYPSHNTYARPLENGKTEEFWQTLQRVVETVYTIQKEHCTNLNLPWNPQKSQKSAQEMFRRMWEFKFLPPGRGLWAMDLNLLKAKGSAALNNCAFVSTDEIATNFTAPFTFAMDMLMLGVGVGGDTEGAGLVTIKEPKKTDETFIVEDSREGWIKLLEVVLGSFVGYNALPTKIDYSLVRPEGAPIKGFGGVSSGPAPLREMIEDIIHIFYEHPFPYKIDSTIIVDLFNLIGRCVVAGNTRRSAELLIGKETDKEFIVLKQDKKKLMHHRWASNNSIACVLGMKYDALAESTAINGEPGYLWLDNARKYGRMKDLGDWADIKVKGFNPCVEQNLESFEACNLVETFPANHKDYDDFKITLKYAYLYAKSVTLVPIHDMRSNAIMMRNRRIGTSVSGVTQAFNKFGKREILTWLDRGYTHLKELDKIYSDWLCIPRSIKITTVKPSGTISLLPGVTPGIHYPHSEYYIRNVRVAKNSPLLQACKDAGYLTEDDKYSPTTAVVSFPIHEKYFTRGKDEVSMWEQLENAAQLQYYWSDNAVSITVTFNKQEASQIATALQLYETRLKSVSFLPMTEHGYEQAPYITITKEKYETLHNNIHQIKIKESVHDSADKYCDGEACLIT